MYVCWGGGVWPTNAVVLGPTDLQQPDVAMAVGCSREITNPRVWGAEGEGVPSRPLSRVSAVENLCAYAGMGLTTSPVGASLSRRNNGNRVTPVH